MVICQIRLVALQFRSFFAHFYYETLFEMEKKRKTKKR